VDMLETRLSQMVDELIPKSNQAQHRFERIPCGRVLIMDAGLGSNYMRPVGGSPYGTRQFNHMIT
jgi:hypothetical protein